MSVKEHEFKEKQKDLYSLLEVADTAEATVPATWSINVVPMFFALTVSCLRFGGESKQ